MAAMDWNTLTAPKTVSGSIRHWINYEKVDPEEVIAEAEDWMAMNLRTADMQAHDHIPLVPGKDQIVVATELTRFLDPISVFIVGHGYLRYRPVDEIDGLRFQNGDGSFDEGIPCRYALVAGTRGAIQFDVASDGDYDCIVTYYQRPEPLSVDNQTNTYTEQYRILFKEALLARAYQSPKDSMQENEHTTKALGLIQQLKVNDDLKLRAQQHLVRVYG